MDDDDLGDALRAAMRGDEAGFSVLWRAMQPALLRYLRVVAGDEAEDIASETWLQAVRDLRTFSGDVRTFRVWLFRVARNRGIDELRRVGRRREEPREVSDGGNVSVPDAAAEVIERGGTEWALAVIASLPPDQAEAVMLRVVAGFDVRQTARVLGKRPGAVRVAAMRGLRGLAQYVDVRDRGKEHTWTTATARVGVSSPPRPKSV